jgi:hypothetical protein
MKRKNQTAWKLIKRFPIGTCVTVTAVMTDTGKYDYTTKQHARHWEASERRAFTAWVCGATWKCNGTIFPGTGYDEDYSPAYLKVTSKVPVLLVRKSMFEKEIAVPVEGVEVATDLSMNGAFFTTAAPLCPGGPQKFLTEQDRQVLRECAAEMPRGANGRFQAAAKRCAISHS